MFTTNFKLKLSVQLSIRTVNMLIRDSFITTVHSSCSHRK